MFEWRRVGGRTFTVVASAAFTVIGAIATLGLAYVLITGDGQVISWSGVIFAELFLVGWTVFAFRLGRIGVFVSPAGVRNRSLLRTQTLTWDDIKRFETKPVRKGLGSSSVAMLRVHAVWILLGNGAELQTSLMYRTSAERPAASGLFGERTGLVLTEQRCQQALRELRGALESARGRSGP
jgi:phosphate/sulfate permease